MHAYILIYDRLINLSVMNSEFSRFKFGPRFRYKLTFLNIHKKLNRESRPIRTTEIKGK